MSTAAPATPVPSAARAGVPPLLRVPSAAGGMLAGSASAPASAATSPSQQQQQAGGLTPAVASPPVTSAAVALSPSLPLHQSAASLPPSSLPVVLPLSSAPFEGSHRHVSFVLLAEFDILKGSQLKYQYPRPTNIKENLLAESMLPEGAHLRESDWTVSFLTSSMMQSAYTEGQKTKQKAKEKAEKAAAEAAAAASVAGGVLAAVSASASSHADVSWDIYLSPPEPTPDCGLCVLNLVRTKMDKSVKRGAIVKALAIVTRHRFYPIFKSLLMLCLDQYFDCSAQQDQIQLLANLYHTINNIDFDAMPLLTPLQKRLHRATRLKTANSPAASDFFNTTVKWNTSTSAGGPAAAAPMGSPIASAASAVATLPLRIPLCMESDEVLEASLTTLVNRFQSGVLDIYTAVLAEKRVVFMGYQQPAAVCCDCVLAACLLISPPVTGTLNRAFPYANLTNMDFLTVPGFIAGVTNPIFESRNNWWDLLCNISNGELTFAPGYAEEIAASNASSAEKSSDKTALSALVSGDNQDKLALLDSAFFAELIAGIHLKLGEEFVRCSFRDYTHHLLLLLQNDERFVFDDAAGNWKHFYLSAFSFRIASFTKSKQCAVWRNAQRQFQAEGSMLKEMDSIIRHHVRTLQVLASAKHAHSVSANGNASLTTVAELLVIYHDLVAHVRSRDEILELLSMLPESQGGLFPVAVGLMHKHPGIRASCIELLHRIDQEPEGTKYVSALNYFLLITFYRAAKSEGFRFEQSDDEDEGHPNQTATAAGNNEQQHQLARTQSMPAQQPQASGAAGAASSQAPASAASVGAPSPSLAEPRRISMRSPSSDMGSIAIAATPINALTPSGPGGAGVAATPGPASATAAAVGAQHPASANHQAYMAEQAQRWNPPAAAQTAAEGGAAAAPTSALTIHTVTPAGTDTIVGNYPNAAAAAAPAAAVAPAGSPTTPAALIIPSSPASPADDLSSRSVRSPTFHSDEAPASATDPKIPSIAE